MNRHHQEWTDRFSDYLAEELDAETRASLEAHVADCGACRRTLEELRDVIARARSMPEIGPTRDLWPGIAASIGAPVRTQAREESDVIALPTARRTAPAGDGRISLTRGQLAAAAIILVALSTGATLWAGPGVAERGPETDSVATAPVGPVVMAAAEVPGPPAGLSDELTRLQSVLDTARERLDPNTVRVIERNLAVIERAIADSREALALDPENQFLEHHLERVYERKLAYLQDAARVLDMTD